ncbi:phasin [Ancylobacter polymorphus]|uniref:Phasin n=1 Tax=Ancylobacter polymorphus TaxID=223390 RepID=A0ABU0BAH4_9HYPH|nr:phasin [Ancylobacter polymorphus]MDQ0302836.1 phasin [Ancylobacter polymorphus]
MVDAAPVTPTPKKTAKATTAAFESSLPKFEMPKFEVPKFDVASAVEVPAVVREMAEKSVQNARETYEKFKANAEETTDLLEDTYSTASRGLAEYNTAALESLRTNVNAAFDYMGALFGAKSVSEAVELSTGHLRKQFDVLSSQAKELSTLAQKVATDTAEPIKASVEKTIKKAS